MKNKFFKILGILISSIIGVLPWILIYVFCNKDFYFLNILIPFSLFIGYKLFNHKIDNNNMFILSLIIISIATYIIIPILLLIKEYNYISIANLILLYQLKIFIYNLTISFIASMLFITLGIYILYNYRKL